MALKVENKGKTAEIWLYGEIGENMWADTISAKQFADKLKAVGKVNDILLHINSPGGVVWDGLAIYNLLKSHPAKVEITIDGLAASIASVVAMSGDTVKMADNAFFMIHNPWTWVGGEAKDLRTTAERLDQVREGLVNTYLHKTSGKSNMADISGWMDTETWFTAREAHEKGFVDEVTNELAIAAKIDLKRYDFKNLPSNIKHLQINENMALRARIAHMNMWAQKSKSASATSRPGA